MRKEAAKTNCPTVAENLRRRKVPKKKHDVSKLSSKLIAIHHLPGQKAVERIIGDQNAINELHNA
jgi:hypothetical protein